MKVKFKDVQDGERFVTQYSKRRLTAVKVAPTSVEGHTRNAVVLLDHADQPAHDLGTLIFENDDVDVEVTR